MVPALRLALKAAHANAFSWSPDIVALGQPPTPYFGEFIIVDFSSRQAAQIHDYGQMGFFNK